MAHQPLDESTPAGCCTDPLTLRAPSTHESVEHLTDRVGAYLHGLPMPEKRRYRLILALHEALTNAMEHGNANDPSKHVTVTCRTEPTRVVVAVDDEGNGFDPANLPDPTRDENLLKEGGRGIFLIRRYTDECRFERNGRRVVLVARLS